MPHLSRPPKRDLSKSNWHTQTLTAINPADCPILDSASLAALAMFGNESSGTYTIFCTARVSGTGHAVN